MQNVLSNMLRKYSNENIQNRLHRYFLFVKRILYLKELFNKQSGRSPEVVALFSATNFSSYIIELLQLHDTIQIELNYAWLNYNIAIRSHLIK